MSKVSSTATTRPDSDFQDALAESAVAIVRAMAAGVDGPNVSTSVSDAFTALRRASDLLAVRPSGHADEAVPGR